MKLLTYLTWACGITALILMILGVIEYFVESKIITRHPAYIFQAANSLLLLGILSKLLIRCTCKEKEEK